MTTNNANDCYENFRNVLTLNLMSVIEDTTLLQNALKMVDITAGDFEITKKKMEIIPANDMLPVIKCYLAAKAVANVKKSTLQQYRYKLVYFFDKVHKSFTDVTANDVRVFLFNFKMERNASDRYLETIRITINSFFQWLTDNDYIQKNPCAKVDKIRFQPKRREALTPFQLEELRWHTKNAREKALIDFLFSTGCRVSECADVRLSDINWDKRAVHIRHGKGDKERTVFFNAEAEVTMKEYLKTRTDQTDALFIGMRAPFAQLGKAAIEKTVREIGERAGIRVYPHKLRHTFATAGIKGGMSLVNLQELMGHTKPETTLIYVTQDHEDLHIEHQRVYA